MSPRVIVHLGTPVDGPGGISTVMRAYRDLGLTQDWPLRFLPSWRDPSEGNRAAAAAACAARLWLAAAGGRVQAVHAHAAAGASFWRKAALLRPVQAAGLPTVLHLHDGRWPDWVARLPPGQRRVAAHTLAAASRVAVLHPGLAAAVRHVAPDARTVVLPNPVAVTTAAAGDGWPAARARRRDVVLFLGRLSVDKGLPVLLKAWARRVAAGGPSPGVLVCAGDGDRAQAHAWALEAGLGALLATGQLCFPGWVDGAARRGWLERAAALVLPSRAEGQPMAALEAMAAGVPVVATAVGGLPDLLSGGAGVLLPPAPDEVLAGDLACALRRLHEDPARARLTGWLGRQRVLREHAAPRSLARVAALYDELRLRRRPPAQRQGPAAGPAGRAVTAP